MHSTEAQIIDASNQAVVPTAIVSRKNGKAASCEPCRKRKIRCDHQRPICARCRRRGLEDRCFYHPAPLTKQEVVRDAPPAEELSMWNQNHQGSSASDSDPPVVAISKNAISQSFADAPFLPTLGTHEAHNSHEYRVRAVQEIVAQLRHVSLIQKLLRAYLAATTAGLLPGALILPAVSDLNDRWQRSGDIDSLSRSIAEEIVLSTTRSIEAHSLPLPSDFCNRHHGKNLRLEILGIIYAIAALSCLYGLVNDCDNRDAFIQNMWRHSSEALRLARDMGTEVTDAVVWLQHQNFLLATALQGYVAPASWRRICDLTSDILGLNMHRESSYASIPFYLAECRKRIFAATYHQDKMVASLTDRPPRLSSRYSDCKLPLDLTDEELLTEDPLQLTNIQGNLTSEGWCTERRYSNASWARIRFNLAMFREEILEYSLLQPTREHLASFKNLSERSHDQWNALPDHFHYSPECWNSGLSDPLCFMLTSTYLSYRNLDFQIFRLLGKIDAESLSLLLHASMDIIATVIHVGGLRTRASFLAHDFELLILSYGISSAAVLANALEHHGTAEFPAGLSRSKVIRSLSVFVSMLESLQGLTGTKKSLSIESNDLISRVLDKVLEKPDDSTHATSASALATQPGYSFPSSSENAPPNSIHLDMLMSNTDGPLLDNELFGFMNGLDWANIWTDWTTA